MDQTQSRIGESRILIKGAGEMATGVAVRLHCAGFRRILLLEAARPMAVRRAVSFCEAVYDGTQKVEGISAVRLDRLHGAAGDADMEKIWADRSIPIAVDPEWSLLPPFRPEVSVDAVIAKRNLGTRIGEAPLVVALGPGFAAGTDAHRVVETNRGHDLGRIFTSGSAQPNTGVPGDIGGFTVERVLRAPVAGRVEQCRAIGDTVSPGDVVCTVGGEPVRTVIAGVVRGCIRPGIAVEMGTKLADVDPRARRENCFTVSEKARALGGAVLEAVCSHLLAML